MAFDYGALLLDGQFGERLIHRDAFAAGELLQLGPPPFELWLGKRLDGALFQRQLAVRYHQVHVQPDGVAEALARRACAERVIETEQARLGLRITEPAILTLELLRKREQLRVVAGGLNVGFPMAFAETNFERIYKAAARIGADREPVDQDVDVVEIISLVTVGRLQL